MTGGLKTMHIAICDDDANTARDLQQKILHLPSAGIDGIDIFTDPDKFAFAAETTRYDLVFMDIELGSESGIELSGRLLRSCPDMQIVFVSGYDDYYLQVYDVEHVFFLRKPVDSARLLTALETARSHLAATRSEFISIISKQGVTRIPQSGIMYLEKNRRLILFHTSDGESYKAYGKFSDFSDKLNSFFFQCHTSFVVNFRYVSEMRGRKFIISPDFTAVDRIEAGADSVSEIEIPVSKTYYNEAKEAFLRYLG